MTKRIEKEKAIKLRTQDRMSYLEITKQLNVSKGTLARWLKDYPLTDEEILVRRSNNAKNGCAKRIENNKVDESKIYKEFGIPKSNLSKGKVAECAVLLRLSLLGYSVYSSSFDGDKYDWIAEVNGKLVKIQVKWASKGRYGKPCISLRCGDGRGSKRKYKKEEYDIIVGYDIITDSCYVWSWDEVQNKNCKTVSSESFEKWDKLSN